MSLSSEKLYSVGIARVNKLSSWIADLDKTERENLIERALKSRAEAARGRKRRSEEHKNNVMEKMRQKAGGDKKVLRILSTK